MVINYINLKKSVTHQRSESRVANMWMARQCDLDFCSTNLNINRLPPLTIWHVCTKFHLHCRSDISFLRYRAETKIVLNFCSIFRSCDLDLCPTNLIINRLPPLTIRHMSAKFHLDPTFCS
jgi:hypothetical protein